eukprot:14566477-Alexandrium_andersonii.AAC.1
MAWPSSSQRQAADMFAMSLHRFGVPQNILSDQAAGMLGAAARQRAIVQATHTRAGNKTHTHTLD